MDIGKEWSIGDLYCAQQLIQINPGTAILDFTITTEVDVDIKEVNNTGSDLHEASKELLLKVRQENSLPLKKSGSFRMEL